MKCWRESALQCLLRTVSVMFMKRRNSTPRRTKSLKLILKRLQQKFVSLMRSLHSRDLPIFIHVTQRVAQ
jgi:hypothetical protein